MAGGELKKNAQTAAETNTYSVLLASRLSLRSARISPPLSGCTRGTPFLTRRTTPSSWINQVERFFALVAEKQIKRGAHNSVKQLIAAIEAFITHHNKNPKAPALDQVGGRHSGVIERFCRRTLDLHAQSG